MRVLRGMSRSTTHLNDLLTSGPSSRTSAEELATTPRPSRSSSSVSRPCQRWRSLLLPSQRWNPVPGAPRRERPAPARIADVMRVLRRISERVQVILATHSPFVINELQGDEVTVVTRPDGQGTRVRRLCDTPNFEERSKVYALGELWVSYADGKNEEPLLAEVGRSNRCSWAKAPVSPRLGVLEPAKVAPDGWTVVDALPWSTWSLSRGAGTPDSPDPAKEHRRRGLLPRPGRCKEPFSAGRDRRHRDGVVLDERICEGRRSRRGRDPRSLGAPRRS